VVGSCRGLLVSDVLRQVLGKQITHRAGIVSYIYFTVNSTLVEPPSLNGSAESATDCSAAGNMLTDNGDRSVLEAMRVGKPEESGTTRLGKKYPSYGDTEIRGDVKRGGRTAETETETENKFWRARLGPRPNHRDQNQDRA